jgi:hypothetical protein
MVVPRLPKGPRFGQLAAGRCTRPYSRREGWKQHASAPRLNIVRKLVAGVALTLVAISLVVPFGILPVLAPDETAPTAISRLLPEAKRSLAAGLDLPLAPLAYVRYVGLETRERDDLVILRFELRSFPYLSSEGAYLVSRCTAIENLDPTEMDGGGGVSDFETDPELEYARSDAQTPCSS